MVHKMQWGFVDFWNTGSLVQALVMLLFLVDENAAATTYRSS